MGDSSYISCSSKNFEVPSSITSKKASRRCLLASAPKTFKYMDSLYHGSRENAGHISFFLLKVAALEMTRRFSMAKCPLVWHSLQALQILCYPPFKWIQRWTPFKGLVVSMQKLSRPLLLLSVATAFSDQSLFCKETSDAIDNSQPSSEPSAEQPTQDTRDYDEDPEIQVSENWLLKLQNELKKQNIALPERINDDELNRFYAAANGDFACLLSSIKKTIRWRETYHILSAQELEMWSHLVFWHGCDVKLRPCLIIRLGLACSSLTSQDRPCFSQAIVSQIEHGVLHLVNVEDPQITVLMDCEGLSPMRFPMQMLRSCSVLMQENYPNRLGCLFIIRLPPVVRVIAQTFIKVLKPITRQKLRIEGEMYRKVLSENFQTIPSFLGGKCSCLRCSNHPVFDTSQTQETSMPELSVDFANDEELSSVGDPYQTNLHLNANCEQVLRTVIIGILMLWIFISFLAGMYDPDSLFFSPS